MKKSTLLLTVAVCFVLGCGWQGRGQLKKGGPKGTPTPQARQKAPEPVEIYKSLRGQFLSSKPEEIGMERPGPGSKAYAVLMEMGFPEGLASIVSLNTGDASLYMGGGGGIIGGGSYDEVRRAARAFVAESDKHLSRMAAAKEFPHADVDRVRFYVRTPDGVYTAEAGADELAEGKHELSPLFDAGNEVITQLRLNTKEKE